MMMLSSAATAEDYYIDAELGDDANAGTSADAAWQSLDRVNSHTFEPGDRILFKAGTRYTGMLKPQGSGAPGAPIIIDMFGLGPKPRIDAEGQHPQALHLYNVEYYTVSNLRLTNLGPERAGYRKGLYIEADQCGTLHRIHIRNLHIHDVNAITHDKQDPSGGVDLLHRGGGIVWRSVNADGAEQTRFNGLLIENCLVENVDQDGIRGFLHHVQLGKFRSMDRRYWVPNLNVVVRGNVIRNTGGSGIILRGCRGALVERNTLTGGGTRVRAGVAGMYAWGCDDTLFQYNEVSGLTGKGPDRMAYDSDFNSRGTIIQYNYSYNNDGGFAGVFTGAFKKSFHTADWNIKNDGTIIRYNISRNDGKRRRYLFMHMEDATNVQIYNNVFYVGKGIQLRGFSEKLTDQYHLRNNIFYVEGAIIFNPEYVADAHFSHNVFFGNIENMPHDPAGLTADPRLVDPGSGGPGRHTLDGYRLRDDSPCIGAGVMIINPGLFDFWGNLIKAGTPRDIGAHQR